MDASFKKKAQWIFKVGQGERYPVDYDNLHSAQRRRAFKEALDAMM